MKSYQKQIQVTAQHLDKLNHVNNTQYVKWVEEIAVEHWDILKHKTPFVNDYWVMVEHNIQYKKQVFLNQELTIKTYPLEPNGVKQPRAVEFYKDDVLVVKSITHWVLMDAENHRIKRFSREDLTFLDK